MAFKPTSVHVQHMDIPVLEHAREEGKNGVYQQEEHCLPWNGVHWVGRRSVWPWQSLVSTHRPLSNSSLQHRSVTLPARHSGFQVQERRCTLVSHSATAAWYIQRENWEKYTPQLSAAVRWAHTRSVRNENSLNATAPQPWYYTCGAFVCEMGSPAFPWSLGRRALSWGFTHRKSPALYSTARFYIKKKPPKYVISTPRRNLSAVQRHTFTVEEGLSKERHSGSSMLTHLQPT